MKNRFTPFFPVFFILYIIIAFNGYTATIAGGLPQSTAEVFSQFYTIQVGSYAAEERAQVKYQELAEALHISQLDHLRIEHVGSYYTVRLGKFDSWAAASKLLANTGGHLAGAAILRAYIEPERITRMYQPAAADLPVPVPEETVIQEERQVSVVAVEPQKAEGFQVTQAASSLSDTTGPIEYYTIQADSYGSKEAAEKRYLDLAATLDQSQLDHLRIEHVGSYYTVRLGKFDSRAAASELLANTGEHLAGAVILQAYIKPERISWLYQAEPETSRPPAPEPAEEVLASEPVIPAGEETEKAPPPELPSKPLEEREEEAGKPVDTESAKPIAAPQETPQVMPSEAVGTGAVAAEDALAAYEAPPLDVVLESAAELTGESIEEIAPVGEDTRVFEQLGQPTGLYPVRVVKVITKNNFGGKLPFPARLEYDPIMDEIYLTVGGGTHPSSRIIVYGPDYYPVASLGVGREVLNPRGLITDAEGNIYIAQALSKDKEEGQETPPRIMVLNAAFFKVRDIFFDDIPGLTGEGFFPVNLAISQNELYITGNKTNGILVLDTEGTFKRWLVPMKVGGIREDVGNDPNHPNAHRVSDVVVDSNGRIYIVCDPESRIFVLSPEEKFLFAFGMKGGSTGKLSRPKSIAVDVVRQALYVVDYMRHSVNIYNYNGKFLFEIGGLGDRPGWFQYPSHVAVDRRSNLIVADYFNHRVQILQVP
jgi:DNA-binding beta-propeller fold protein YncE